MNMDIFSFYNALVFPNDEYRISISSVTKIVWIKFITYRIHVIPYIHVEHVQLYI